MKYKKLDDFKNNTAKAGAKTYQVGFTNCRDKVAQAYRTLDLGKILGPWKRERKKG